MKTCSFFLLLASLVAGHTILLGSISDHSHLSKLDLIANHIGDKYHTILVTEKSGVPSISARKVEIIALEDKEGDSFLGKNSHTFLESFAAIRTHFTPRVMKFYVSMRAIMKERTPSLVLCDVITFGCIAAANELGLPLIVNNPGIPFDLIHDPIWVPFILSTRSPTMTFTQTLSNGVEKLAFVLVGFGSIVFDMVIYRYQNQLNWWQVPADLLNKDIILENTFPFFSLPRSTPASSIFVGPLFPTLEPTNKIPFDSPIVLITSGSLISFDQETLNTITSFFCQNTTVCIVGSNHIEVPNCNVIHLPWANLTAEYSSKNIQLVISHGGGSTVMESLYFGIPQLVIPSTGDGFQNAHLISRIEAGFIFIDVKVTPNTLKRVNSESLAVARKKAQQWAGFAKTQGGLKKVAAIIELALEDSSKMTDYANNIPWISKNLVYIVFTFMATIAIYARKRSTQQLKTANI